MSSLLKIVVLNRCCAFYVNEKELSTIECTCISTRCVVPVGKNVFFVSRVSKSSMKAGFSFFLIIFRSSSC